MEMTVTGHRVEVTDALREYAQKKVGRVVNDVDEIRSAHVEFSVNKNPSVPDNQIVEITVNAKGTVLRAEESSPNMYASMDLAADKLERQVRRYQQRLHGHDRHHRQKTALAVTAEAIAPDLAEDIEREIVPTKAFPVVTMSPDDAAAQMDLLGHDFFVFVNQFTGQVNVIYHRKDGNYGLIEPGA